YDSLPEPSEMSLEITALRLDDLSCLTAPIEPTHWSGDIVLDQPAVIIFTSGTTGRPKGAVLTYGNLFYSAMASAYRIGVLPNDRWCCVLPLYHVGGLSIIVRSALYGTAVDLQPRFDLDSVQQALTTQPISLISLV